MTPHETLKHFVTAAARAARLEPPVFTEEVCEGAWNQHYEPCLNWSGIHFHPEDLYRTINTTRGHSHQVTDRGWVLSCEKHFSGDRETPPDMDLVEFARCSSEWAAATAAVVSLITEHISNAVSDAAEALNHADYDAE